MRVAVCVCGVREGKEGPSCRCRVEENLLGTTEILVDGT